MILAVLAAAAADTLRHVDRIAITARTTFAYLGTTPAERAEIIAFMHAMERWHEFYLLAGTAAVTLVGLLFVALSFHLDALLHESRAHLLSAARLTFGNFIFVLVLSLTFLVPDAGPVFLGMFVVLASTIFLVQAIWSWFKSRKHADPGGHERSMARRRRLAVLGYFFALSTGLLLLMDHRANWLYNFVGTVCLLLGNGAGMSWDMLVQVGKLRRAQEIQAG